MACPSSQTQFEAGLTLELRSVWLSLSFIAHQLTHERGESSCSERGKILARPGACDRMGPGGEDSCSLGLFLLELLSLCTEMVIPSMWIWGLWKGGTTPLYSPHPRKHKVWYIVRLCDC